MTEPPVRILRIAAGGDGVGKLADGRTVFVPRTAPGDLVVLAELQLQKRFGRARVGELLERGPARAEPRCAHYDRDRCGGCQLQHLTGPAQRAAKAAIVGEALRRFGGLDVADPEVVPGEAEWSYRTRITLAVQGGRIGFHRLGEAGRVFDLERCEIAAPPLQALWDGIRAHRALLPPDAERVVLRLDREGGRHLIVETRGAEVWRNAGRLGSALGPAGGVVVWWKPEGGAARVLSGSGEAFPATVFEQVQPALGERIRRHAVALAAPEAGMRMWDLYAGIGETTELLLAAGAQVESVELDARAVELAARRSAYGPPPGSQAPGGPVGRHAGRVEDVVGHLRAPAVVVTNPPRTGMDERAVAVLARVRPQRLVYVSCDPATLARDVKRLGAGWRPGALKAFDLFPQTAHVETVLLLEAA